MSCYSTMDNSKRPCSPIRKLSQADLEDLLDPQMNFLPLFQDLNPGFESLYSPYSPNQDSSSTTDTSSPPNSHYEDIAINVNFNLQKKRRIYPLKLYLFRQKMQQHLMTFF